MFDTRGMCPDSAGIFVCGKRDVPSVEEDRAPVVASDLFSPCIVGESLYVGGREGCHMLRMEPIS